MGPKTELIVIRHGETDWNIEQRYQGHIDIPLNQKGHQQAQSIAKRLASQTFSTIYSSDLKRAHQTAQAIASIKEHSIILDDRLREQNLGVLQGVLKSEAAVECPEANKLFQKSNPSDVIPQGESRQQFYDRTSACFQELVHKHLGESIVLVAHRGVLDCLFSHVLQLPLKRPRQNKGENVSFNKVSWEQGDWILNTWGDVAHLTPWPTDPV